MELSDLEKQRYSKMEALRQRGVEPYPTRSEVTMTIGQAVKAFEDAEKNGATDPISATLAGRLRSIRLMGKLGFAHVEDASGRIQFFLRVNELGEEKMTFFKEYFDLGDFIQGTGTLTRSRTGEISLILTDFAMLAKAISPLPAAKDEVVDGVVVRHATLADPETRYRQRYADLAVNPEVRQIFRTRTALITALRKFLDSHDFMEVETPILQPIYGGAAARPFITHHNQLKQDLYLRISFELYLKRLLVGGFDRVYEIGRDFRNEGVSYKHNPEFTQLEFYWAYADYLKVMELTEQMIAFACDQVLGTRKVTYNGQEIDFNPPWKRVDLRQGLINAIGIDIQAYPDAASLEKVMLEKGMKFKPGEARGKLIDHLLGEYLEPTFIQPTFLYDYPRDISPLAKTKPGDPTMVERFEGFVGGMELCNAFTELNDPQDQENRFLEMGRQFKADDEENMPLDEDYIHAMAYGMPPCGGFGIGVDRLAMLFTDNHSIREVILFPPLRESE
jgi:lysyl-tRNA synthetase class 2